MEPERRSLAAPSVRECSLTDATSEAARMHYAAAYGGEHNEGEGGQDDDGAH